MNRVPFYDHDHVFRARLISDKGQAEGATTMIFWRSREVCFGINWIVRAVLSDWAATSTVFAA